MATIEISLTRFVDFAIKAGTQKITSLKETKNQSLDPYNPAFDYYKQIREAIIAHHKGSKPFSHVENIAANVSNKSKAENYPIIASGYKKFRGRKVMAWHRPPQKIWASSGVAVSLNPELCLEFDGRKHVIKLYFKGDEPRKDEVKSILSLMDDQLQDSRRSLAMCLLDVRRSKLFIDSQPNPSLLALMRGEAASIATIWPNL